MEVKDHKTKVSFHLCDKIFSRLKRMYPRKGQITALAHALLLEHALVDSIQRDPECYEVISRQAELKGINPITLVEVEAKKFILGYASQKVRTDPEIICKRRQEVNHLLTSEQRNLLKRIKNAD